MNENVLIIEDVKEMSDLVAMYLQKDGMNIMQAETAEIAFEILNSFKPDLIILDLNLPGMDGFEFLSRYRKENSSPVIIVSARDADEDIITGLGYGADEFVTKPFSPRVLAARVKAIIRRSQEKQNSGDIQSSAENKNLVKFGPYILDTESYTLRKVSDDSEKAQRIMLSAKEFDVLEFFAQNSGKTLTPEVIYNGVWNNMYGDLSAVAVYVQRLRKKLEKNPENPVFIETVFGLGYRFNSGEK